MTVRVNVVCFDLPADSAAAVAKAAGGELYETGEAGPAMIRVTVAGARKAQPAARKATTAVRAALEGVLGPGPHSALAIIEEEEDR